MIINKHQTNVSNALSEILNKLNTQWIGFKKKDGKGSSAGVLKMLDKYTQHEV